MAGPPNPAQFVPHSLRGKGCVAAPGIRGGRGRRSPRPVPIGAGGEEEPWCIRAGGELGGRRCRARQQREGGRPPRVPTQERLIRPFAIDRALLAG
jgi:hypothetical protein